MAAIATADTVWAAYEESPYPSMAEVLYLSCIPFFILGLLLICRGGMGRNGANLIDPLIIATGAGMLMWVLLLDPAAYAPTLSLLGDVVRGRLGLRLRSFGNFRSLRLGQLVLRLGTTRVRALRKLRAAPFDDPPLRARVGGPSEAHGLALGAAYRGHADSTFSVGDSGGVSPAYRGRVHRRRLGGAVL